MKSQNIKLDDFDQLTGLLTDDLKKTPRSALRVLTGINVDRALKDYVDEFVFNQVKHHPYVGIENLLIVRRKINCVFKLTEALSRAASTPDERAVAHAALRLLAALTSLDSIQIEVSSLKVDVMQYALLRAIDDKYDYREMSGYQFSMICNLANYLSNGVAISTLSDYLKDYIDYQKIPVSAAVRQIVKRALLEGGSDEVC